MYCGVKETKEENGSIIFEVHDSNPWKPKQRIVSYNTLDNVAHCSCKLFEQDGIPCRHILCVFKGRGIDAIPSYYIVHRWTKSATCSLIFDMDTVVDEELVGYDIDKIRVLRNGIIDLKKSLLESTNVCVDNKTNDLEAYVESTIPVKIDIHPPKHSITKGSGKRIPSGKEKAIKDKQKRHRLCKSCGKYAQHDSRNCPMKEA
ncbi:protein FAR1-RELATED SEQUENCE 7-like [Chenopodium quinoa]|uniref:protein FAR1-RELATED SEQUENCE 7-like n=1 Tax=Chenopodium quinoa TaxID=63459 RepID=UPI000B781C81|nr:protein FAR1-RELATED SEQUENCE 7-like [Chenopodium quinoa]